MQLADGTTVYEGRLEIWFNDRWANVCGNGWDIQDADVVCKELGYDGAAEAFDNSDIFGEGTGSIILENVECLGTESSLTQCLNQGWGVHNCTHSRDAGVRCIEPSQLRRNVSAESLPSGTTRLVNGATNKEGRLEVYYSSSWGTVCDDSWTAANSDVACRQLGFAGSSAFYSNAHFGQGSGNIWLDNVGCTGSENSISECSHNGWGVHNCNHGEDIGILCYGNSVTMRLVNGATNGEGRLEVYYSSAWGTVCDDGWTAANSDVACRQLGFAGSSAFYGNAHFGQGSGNIWLDNVGCTGSENTISECSHNGWGVHNCNHGEDIGIVCYGAIRLVNGATNKEGRLEVYYSSAWGTVCDDSWTAVNSDVACRQLGFAGSSAFYGSAHFGQGSGNIWLDNVGCTGSENTISECSHNGWGVHNCNHGEDIGIVCYGK
ncbi:deleted in malignant brain tumors 1 protein-like [Anneissia japonica]|uniref:deleted in malignant brain tumors 1 protein-like n=1 Tax=Anneissia japonica TaxID=1529436 RepID=UPI0014255072|nr:deleted in malignant brain tumors 1 protein-like [Anneissia japonica]